MHYVFDALLYSPIAPQQFYTKMLIKKITFSNYIKIWITIDKRCSQMLQINNCL